MKRKAVFFDLDGTLYFRQKAIEGAIETVDYLKSKGYICRFLTNTDSKKPSHILDRVKNLGFNIELDEIFTPVTASIKFLKYNKDAKIYALVSDNIIDEYKEFNISLENVDYLIIGDCRDKVSYDNLNKAFKLIGDDISTDIVGANNIGAMGALVKTGKYIDQVNLDVGTPDLVLDSVADLMRYL